MHVCCEDALDTVIAKHHNVIRNDLSFSLSFRLWISQGMGQPYGFFFSTYPDPLHPLVWDARWWGLVKWCLSISSFAFPDYDVIQDLIRVRKSGRRRSILSPTPSTLTSTLPALTYAPAAAHHTGPTSIFNPLQTITCQRLTTITIGMPSIWWWLECNVLIRDLLVAAWLSDKLLKSWSWSEKLFYVEPAAVSTEMGKRNFKVKSLWQSFCRKIKWVPEWVDVISGMYSRRRGGKGVWGSCLLQICSLTLTKKSNKHHFQQLFLQRVSIGLCKALY